MNKTPKVKAPTVTELRASIEKTGLVFCPYLQPDADTLRIMPDNLMIALRGLNKAEDYLILPIGIGLPAKLLRDLTPLMGEACLVLKIDRSEMKVIITYSATPDSRSRATLKGIDALEWADPEVHTYFAGRLTDQPVTEPVRIDAWIQKAVSTEDARPQLKKTYGQFAADGWRIHYDSRLPLIMPPSEFCAPTLPGDVLNILTEAKTSANTLTAPASPLLQAARRALKADKTGVIMKINGRLEVESSNPEDFSIITSTIDQDYHHDGANLTIKMSPKFLTDALSGLSGTVTVKVSEPSPNGGRKVYLTDGKREAVVMTMLIED